jgi:hypothetical protein
MHEGAARCQDLQDAPCDYFKLDQRSGRRNRCDGQLISIVRRASAATYRHKADQASG